MGTRQTFTAKIRTRIGGADRLSDVAPIADYIDQCLQPFSAAAVARGRVRKVELTITGDGSDEYDLGGTANWTDGFSTVAEVWRWDDNDTSESPVLMGSDEWEVEDALPSAGSTQIRFITFTPSSSDRVVVVHTALHTVDDTTSSVSSWDEEAFCDLVASRVLATAATALLSRIPQSTDTDTLIGNPDAERAREYRTSAGELMRRFNDHFGIGGTDGAKTGAAFCATEDVDRRPGLLNNRHTHPIRGRGY